MKEGCGESKAYNVSILEKDNSMRVRWGPGGTQSQVMIPLQKIYLLKREIITKKLFLLSVNPYEGCGNLKISYRITVYQSSSSLKTNFICMEWNMDNICVLYCTLALSLFFSQDKACLKERLQL